MPQRNFPGCFVDLFICRLSYNMFLFNYKIFRFSSAFYFVFCFPCIFLFFFLWAKLLLGVDTLIVIPVNFNFNLIYIRIIVLHHYGAYQLLSFLNIPNPATTTFYHSSLALGFSSMQSWSTWCDNTMTFLNL